jgi:hypothetical protein
VQILIAALVDGAAAGDTTLCGGGLIANLTTPDQAVHINRVIDAASPTATHTIDFAIKSHANPTAAQTTTVRSAATNIKVETRLVNT